MHKARVFTHEERLAMTQGRSLQDIRGDKNSPPATLEAVKTNQPLLDDGDHCPVCGAELLHMGGCLECPNKDWSRCG